MVRRKEKKVLGFPILFPVAKAFARKAEFSLGHKSFSEKSTTLIIRKV